MFNRVKNLTTVEETGKIADREDKPEKKVRSMGAAHKIATLPVSSPKEETTVIGEQVVVEGKISGVGNLIIDGKMKGNVELEGKNLTVGPKGRMEGEIVVKDAVVQGCMQGNIIARGTVCISRQADFRGEIKAKNISIDDGAFIEGKIEMDREPHSMSQAVDRPMFKENEKQQRAAAVMAPEPTT